MKHAFPEDELRPISCKPLTRDRENPAHVEVNDVLGNYSLTLIDSLSTLAILASSTPSQKKHKPLQLFQDSVKHLVHLYGDGTEGTEGQGIRARGFDVDSKVQVFETVIRGVGGLLSAHLFAVGDLPIRGYTPPEEQAAYARLWDSKENGDRGEGISWNNGFVYDGQLLRLAYDLGNRLIPAFFTTTGIPYPRVNLRHGIPFYSNSPYFYDAEDGQCDVNRHASAEITETCSAGAGSLVLEFTVLSRLTGDERFEDLAKRAFWAIWIRRSDIGLIGAGIDAESGQWIGSSTGIGAGIDSFFEYALKSHILLSREKHPEHTLSEYEMDPRTLFDPLSDEEQSGESFLQAWNDAHAAIGRHLYRGPSYQHPHYIQADLFTGATRAFWIDSLSAYYPGLLVLSGHVEEAIETHLLTTAVWTRFSALPERWNAGNGGVEGGLGWWPGRPEFIESTYHLYRATQDPWYVHVAEMVLRDIKRRCWTKCGWAGIQDVRSGEKSDRMESFFLGETAKYLFLLFDVGHPLNHLDEPYVFNTEGHPLVIPRSAGTHASLFKVSPMRPTAEPRVCPAPPRSVPLTISAVAAREDIFHAAALARLHLMPTRETVESVIGEYAADHPSISMLDINSPSNYTYFPWTLPTTLVPQQGVCAPMAARPTFDIAFPALPNSAGQPGAPLQRVREGILINSIGGLRLGMIQDVPLSLPEISGDGYRIQAINNLGLGKDEKVFLARDTGLGFLNPTDPNFTRIRDSQILDLVLDLEAPPEASEPNENIAPELILPDVEMSPSLKSALGSLIASMSALIRPSPKKAFSLTPALEVGTASGPRFYISAVTPTGIGAAAIPDWTEAPSPSASGFPNVPLQWKNVFVTDQLCSRKLPLSVPRNHQIIVVKRGGCSFSEKLTNIPAFPPSPKALQLVVVVNYGDGQGDAEGTTADDLLIRPYLDEQQFTSGGLLRHNPVPMVMVGGGERSYEALRRAVGVGIKRRYTMHAQGVPISNLIII
jgi:Glycosyl hydrolase family 47